MNRNSVTRFPGLWRQLLPQCLQTRAWVNWLQRSSMSPLAPSRPSNSHSIFLSLVAVYRGHHCITEQRTPIPHMPNSLFPEFRAKTLPLVRQLIFHNSETLVIPFVLIARARFMLQTLSLRTWILASNCFIQILVLLLPVYEIKLLNLLVLQFSHLSNGGDITI